jgi:hypothetical protein
MGAGPLMRPAPRGRRVRPLNVRLLWTAPDGSEHLRDFATVSEAREARAALVGPDCTDWVIFEIEHPHYPAAGRNLDAIELPPCACRSLDCGECSVEP